MKKLFYLALILLLSSAAIYSQPDAVKKIYEKYAGEKGFVSIDLSDPEMLASVLDESDAEVEDVVKDIKAIKILVYDGEGKKKNSMAKEFQNDVRNIEKLSGFKTMISVNEEDSYVRILTSEDKSKEKDEFLMLVTEENETVMIWIKGKIRLKDMKNLGKIMKGM